MLLIPVYSFPASTITNELSIFMTDLSLVQSLYRGISSICMTGLYDVLRTDSQYRAGVATGAIGHYNNPRPFTTGDPPQIFICELKTEQDRCFHLVFFGV